MILNGQELDELVQKCPHIHAMGDSYCDDLSNIPGCDWDGGYCCNNNYQYWNAYCDNCLCLDPEQGGNYSSMNCKRDW